MIIPPVGRADCQGCSPDACCHRRSRLDPSPPRSGRGGRRFKSCHSDQLSPSTSNSSDFGKLCSRLRATVMATDCTPLSVDDPEMENGSHRSLGGKRLSPLAARSPWTAEVTPNCFIVRDADRQALSYVYYESEPVGDQRPSCSAKMRRDGSQRISRNCRIFCENELRRPAWQNDEQEWRPPPTLVSTPRRIISNITCCQHWRSFRGTRPGQMP